MEFITDKLKRRYSDLAKTKSSKKTILKEFLAISDEITIANMDISLNNMIETYISYSKDNPTELLEEIVDKRKYFKKYLYKLIRQDYLGEDKKGGNPRYLSNECLAYSNLLSNGSYLEGYTTVEALRESRYNTVKDWTYDTNSDCSDFVYFSALTTKRRITAVVTDIKYYCLLSLLEESKDDKRGQRYIVDAAYEAPIFSSTKAKMDVTVSQDDEYITAFESYKQGHTEVKTTIEKHKIEDTTAMAVLNEMRQAYDNKMPPAFDMSDLILLSCVCSEITGESIASGTLTLPLKSIYTEFNGETTRYRKSEYRHLLKKIENLAKYSLELSRYIPETKTFEHRVLHFFDFSYDLSIKGDIFKDMDDIDDIDQIPDEDIDFSNCITRFRLGDTILDAWQQQRVMRVSADGYNSLPSAKSKAFLFYLEGKRIKAYPESNVFIPFSDIKNAIRFDKKVRFKTEIRNMFEIFKINPAVESKYDNAKMIISYEIKINGVDVKFKPFTDYEIATYRLNNASNIIESK